MFKSIWEAIADRDLPALNDALKRGEDPNQINDKGQTPLYVSRGIGTSVLPVRLGARPEVTFIELKGTE